MPRRVSSPDRLRARRRHLSADVHRCQRTRSRRGAELHAHRESGNARRAFAVSGGGLSTRVSTPFPALVVKLTDVGGNPIIGASVGWSAPATGASASFGGGGTAVTDRTAVWRPSAPPRTASPARSWRSPRKRQRDVERRPHKHAHYHAGNSCAQPNLSVQDLIEQDYQALLRRPGDPPGANFWASEAARICALGVDPVQTFLVLGNVFVNSPEYQGFGRSDAAFVSTDLYVAFLGRVPDSGGLSRSGPGSSVRDCRATWSSTLSCSRRSSAHRCRACSGPRPICCAPPRSSISMADSSGGCRTAPAQLLEGAPADCAVLLPACGTGRRHDERRHASHAQQW